MESGLEKGLAGCALVGGFVVASGLCACAGSYLGQGLGWIVGNIIDVVPLVKDVAPWMAERADLINDAKIVVDLNEDLYQTTGAIGGFYGGLVFPLKILIDHYSND